MWGGGNGEKRVRGFVSNVRRGQNGKEGRGYKMTEENRNQKKGIK